MRKTIWKKAFLTALALVSTANGIGAQGECTTREGLTIGLSCGAQGMSTNVSTSKFTGGDQFPSNGTENFASAFDTQEYGLATENLEYNRVIGEVLDYSSLNTFSGNAGFMTNLSLGYKGLFACNQYSVGFKAIFGYEGSSASSYLNVDGASFYFSDVTGEDDARVDTYKLASPNPVKLRGGLVFGAIASLGKEMAWGNFSALVGFKIKQFTLKYLTADPVVADQPTADTLGIATAMDGLVNVGALGDGSPNTYSYSKMKKWIPALTVGFSSDYYINDSMSVGVSGYMDMFANSTFNLKDFGVSSPVVKEGDTQLTDSGNITFKNMTTFGMMVNLNYYFGGMSR